MITEEAKHKVQIALERLWWNEYDFLGNDFIFDIIEDAIRELGGRLPNAEHGGRAPKWKIRKGAEKHMTR
jgi:hypothetical protein